MTAPAYPPLPGGGRPHPNPPLAVHLFAGPGGNEEGLLAAGWTGRQIGFEWDEAACLTAMANGHQRIRADVAAVSLRRQRGRVELVVGAPPCQPWSATGARLGELDREAVLERTETFAHGRSPREVAWHDDRSPLAAEPMRHIHDVRPRLVMLEEVPAVLPLWRHMAGLLAGMGYSVWADVLNAEEYGVPQTRRRAILVASLDAPVSRPLPTHQRYRKGQAPSADLLVRPWVSIREALGWDGHGLIRSNYGTGGNAADRGTRTFDEPAATVTSKVGRNWVLRNNNTANACVRGVDEPAGTMYFGRRSNAVEFHGPEGERRRVTPEEAAILQSFPPGYRFHGGQSKQYEQVGNATPPALAAAVLRPLITHLHAAAAA